MKFSKLLIVKTFFIFIISQLIFSISKANSAEEIKIIYNIFSRTVAVNSLKTFVGEGNASKELRKILKATGAEDEEVKTVLNKDFEIPSSANVFNALTLIVLENTLYIILISSAALAFEILKNSWELNKIKNNFINKNLVNFI